MRLAGFAERDASLSISSSKGNFKHGDDSIIDNKLRKNDFSPHRKNSTSFRTEKQVKSVPTYVPSYVRSVGFEYNQSRKYDCELKRDEPKPRANASKPKTEIQSRRHRNHSSSCAGTKYDPDVHKLLMKYRKRSCRTLDLVRVKEAVAAMEARIQANSDDVIPVVRSKPAKVTVRSKDPVDMESHNEKHQRSMSDPNAVKNSVREMKEMWSQKTEPKKQVNLVECSARSGGSDTSLSSIGSYRSVDKKLTRSNDNASLKEKDSFVDEEASEDTPKSSYRPPILSPRPKNHVLRPRSVTVGQLNLSENRNKERTSYKKEQDSPLATENLSFSEKAKIFGGTKPNNKERIRRHTDVSSPSTPAYRRSWSEDSTQQMGENSNNDVNFDLPYSRVRNDSTLNGLFEKMKAREQKKLEEEKLVTNLQKHARLAKDKRRMRTSTGSSNISTPSDDEEKTGNEYAFKGVRRRSKDVIKTPPKDHSPLAVQKTENSIFGSSLVETDNSRPTIDEADFGGSRRISAFHRLLENKNPDPIARSNSQSSASNASTPGDLPSDNKNLILPRPTKLVLSGSRQRAGTDSSAYMTKLMQNEPIEKCSSLENINLAAENEKTSPPTPDKRSSGFSECEDDVNKEAFPAIVTTTPSVSSDVAEGDVSNAIASQKQESSDLPFDSESPTDSSAQATITPGLSEMNLLEEYDKIAKQLNEEERDGKNDNKDKIRPLSEDSSTMSIDSGYRNSMEEKRWSDFTENSGCDEDEVAVDNQMDKVEDVASSPGTPVKESVQVKLQNIAKELLSTEESYVAVLHLIDQVFHKRILEAAEQKLINMPEQVVGKIFAHIPAIYRFHSSFLLPQLQERLATWDTNPCIGDIMTKAAPFLKMYSLYVQHFDEAMKLIKLWSERSNGFSALIKTIQKLPECNFLTLQHHMLGPVQRVPRYRLLLNDYVKRLPEDSADYEEANTALRLITESATHSNETMKKIENFHKLVNIFNNLADVNFDIVDVSRELLKEGKIIKISARNGEKQERYLYLFSDMLLCCASNRRLGKTYKVTAKIDLDGMTVNEILNPNLPFAFCVNGLQKSMEFATNVQEDKDKWMQAIQDAIEERKDRQRSFRSFIGEQNQVEDLVSPVQTPSTPFGTLPSPSPLYTKQVPAVEIEDADLGTRAPRWIKDHEVTMCMCCSKGFNRLLRRRHHCRACGRVICSECSEHKAILQYDHSRPMKVCSRCFDVLKGRRPSDVGESERKGVLEVEADTVSEKSAIASYLYFSDNTKKRNWARTWCVIPEDELCLYFYKAHQDVRAQMTLPLPGFEILNVDNSEHKFSFKITQAGKSYFFAGDDELTMEKWKYALSQGSRGYDLTKKQVDSLGQHPSSSESEEDREVEKDVSEEDKENEGESNEECNEEENDEQKIDSEDEKGENDDKELEEKDEEDQNDELKEISDQSDDFNHDKNRDGNDDCNVIDNDDISEIDEDPSGLSGQESSEDCEASEETS